MKIIITANLKEIEWLEKEGHIAVGICGEEKEFEVEEDVVVPDFSEPQKPVAKDNKVKKKKK